MYKFLLFVVGLLLCGTVKAQEYDETKLLGTWDVVDLNGPMNIKYSSFKSIEFGEWMDDYCDFVSGAIYDLVEDGYGRHEVHHEVFVMDFFISNHNKLHIGVTDPRSSLGGGEWSRTLRFIITDFTDNEIKLTTYDGKTSFSLRRDLESGAKSIKTEESSTGKEYYNLNGLRLNSPEPGIVITKENNEVRKEIFK
ncbi:MAG: hypothetical protein HDS42_04260 [Bacteroides sp.]|nr:hypothetical protein [Bacteroides sp.]